MNTDKNQSIAQYFTKVFLDKNIASLNKNYIEIPADKVATLKDVADNSYDSIILPFTLNQVFEYQDLVKESMRVLKPGGTVLAILTTIALTPLEHKVHWGFTSVAARYIFSQYFPKSTVEIEEFGNVLIGRYLLNEKPASGLTTEQLQYVDPYFPVIVGVKATKS